MTKSTFSKNVRYLVHPLLKYYLETSYFAIKLPLVCGASPSSSSTSMASSSFSSIKLMSGCSTRMMDLLSNRKASFTCFGYTCNANEIKDKFFFITIDFGFRRHCFKFKIYATFKKYFQL